MVSLDPFLQVDVGINVRSYTCHINVHVELEEPFFESTEWAARFKKDVTKQEIFRKVSYYGVLKAHRRQYLSDTSKSWKRTAQYMLFQLVGSQTPVFRIFVASDIHMVEKKMEVAKTQQKLL